MIGLQEVGKMSLEDEFDEDEQLNQGEDEDDDDFVLTQKLTLSKYVKKTTNQGEVITSWKCQRSVKGVNLRFNIFEFFLQACNKFINFVEILIFKKSGCFLIVELKMSGESHGT